MSAFDDLDNADPNPAIITALSRLDDIDAVTLVYDDETDTRTVDIKPVLHETLQLLAASISLRLQDRPDLLTGMDVIASLRDAVDATGSN